MTRDCYCNLCELHYLPDEEDKHERDPPPCERCAGLEAETVLRGMIASNTEQTARMMKLAAYEARRLIMSDRPQAAHDVLGRALEFHPMHAESFRGWDDIAEGTK